MPALPESGPSARAGDDQAVARAPGGVGWLCDDDEAGSVDSRPRPWAGPVSSPSGARQNEVLALSMRPSFPLHGGTSIRKLATRPSWLGSLSKQQARATRRFLDEGAVIPQFQSKLQRAPKEWLNNTFMPPIFIGCGDSPTRECNLPVIPAEGNGTEKRTAATFRLRALTS